MHRYLIVAPLLAVLAFSAATGPPAEATHETVLHCPTDPNGDQTIDVINDLAAFATAAFTVNPPGHLDIYPGRVLEPSGDGMVDVIHELALVAADFGKNCVLSTSDSGFTPAGMEAGPMSVQNCFSATYTWQTGAAPGFPWIIHDVLASTRCSVAPLPEHSGHCLYSFYYWNGSSWILYGSAGGIFYVTNLGNFICGDSPSMDVAAQDMFLPCNRQWMAQAYYWLYREGSLVTNSWHWVYNGFQSYPCI